MKINKRMIAGFMTFVMAVAVFATPLAEYLPVQGDGLTASAYWYVSGGKITSKSDSRISSALNAIDKQIGVSSSKQKGKSVRDMIEYFLFTSKYAAIGGQGIPSTYANGHGGTKSFTDGGPYGSVSMNAQGCAAYGIWVENTIYGTDYGTNQLTGSSLTANDLKNMLISYGQAGERLFIKKSNSSNKEIDVHTVIFISAFDDGFYYMDWSGTGGDKAKFCWTTYSYFINEVNRYLNSGEKLKSINLKKAVDKNNKSNEPDNSILKGTPLNLGNEFSAAIQSSDGSKALTVDSNGNVSIQKYVGGGNQNWLFTLTDGNYYQIKNPATGKCLDVSNGGNVNDSNIQVWTDNDTSSQRFGIYGSKGQYILKVKYSTTHVVDAGGGNNNVHLWAYASNIAAQKFNIFPLFDSVTVESITSTNAVLKSTYHKPSAAKAVKYGAYIAPKDKWSNSSNRKDLSFTPQTNNVGSTFRYLSFDLTGEFGYKLSPGTTYNYSFYAVYNVGGTNVTYSSGVYSFTTKGTASHTHSYGSWTTTKAATCTSTGTETRKCSCGATETRTIAAKGHNYAASFTMDKAPSCTEAGSKSRHCTVCDAKTEITSIPAHGHEFYGWVDTEYPTCTESGVQTRYCGYCDATETRTVDALGHDYYETTIPPTADSEGYTLHTCSRCGDSYMDNFTAKKTVPVVTGLYIKGRSGDALRLAWDQNTSADGYIIERKDGTKWTRVVKITKNTTTEYRIAKLAAGTAYKFRIRAYKMDGNTPLYSGFTAISARTNPSAVSGLMLKNANSTAVRLAWNKNTSADGYIIVQKVGNKWVRVGKITKNSTVEFRKGGLKSKTSYTFRVTSYKMSGNTALYGATKAITVKTK